MPSSSIHTPFGTLTMPSSSSTTWAWSIRDGCSGAARSMYGRAASASTSSATVTISTPRSVQLRAHLLPLREVETTAAPRCPRDQHDLLPAQVRELEGSPCASGSSTSGATAVVSARPVTAVSGPRATRAGSLVRDDRHSETFGHDAHVEEAVGGARRGGQRHAHLALARAFGLDHPSRARRELVAVDPQLVEDHRATRRSGCRVTLPRCERCIGNAGPRTGP